MTLDQRRLVNRGTLTWSSGALGGGRGALLENLGVFRG